LIPAYQRNILPSNSKVKEFCTSIKILGIHDSTTHCNKLEDQKIQCQHYGTSNIVKMEKLLEAAYLSVELYLLYNRKLGTSIEYEIHLCPSIKVFCIYIFYSRAHPNAHFCTRHSICE
jgi:hypothetical protein